MILITVNHFNINEPPRGFSQFCKAWFLLFLENQCHFVQVDFIYDYIKTIQSVFVSQTFFVFILLMVAKVLRTLEHTWC